jgi:hypothetical protein
MQAYLPLLHIGNSVARVTVVDERVLLLATLALGSALLLIWQPHWPRRLTRGGAPGSPLRAAIVALAVFAVLPSVVPYDHLLVTQEAAHEAAHSSHCHGTPGGCADAPVPSGPGQLFANEPLIAVPAMLALLLLVAVMPLVGVTRRPELRPPMLAASV